jgi:hypothetical protein
MRRPVFAVALGAALLAASSATTPGCASKPAPKMCSAEAPPAHEKGPVSIGMCTNDGPPAGAPAASTDAGADSGWIEPQDGGVDSGNKSASAP